jgi:hypothetical protein
LSQHSKKITCWRLQKQVQQVQMRQQQEPRHLEQEQQERQQELLFYRKRREQQQPRGSPAGAIFSCQFSFDRDENNF